MRGGNGTQIATLLLSDGDPPAPQPQCRRSKLRVHPRSFSYLGLALLLPHLGSLFYISPP